MSDALILYSRDQCGLCDVAAAMVAAAGADLRRVDITADLELLMRYRDTIPVLKHPRSGLELSWPFDAAAVAELLAGDGSAS